MQTVTGNVVEINSKAATWKVITIHCVADNSGSGSKHTGTLNVTQGKHA
jgi:hypothetical protein